MNPYLAISFPPLLFLCIMGWRTYRQESAHRRIDAQQKEIEQLRAELKAFKEAHPFMRILRTGN